MIEDAGLLSITCILRLIRTRVGRLTTPFGAIRGPIVVVGVFIRLVRVMELVIVCSGVAMELVGATPLELVMPWLPLFSLAGAGEAFTRHLFCQNQQDNCSSLLWDGGQRQFCHMVAKTCGSCHSI